MEYNYSISGTVGQEVVYRKRKAIYITTTMNAIEIQSHTSCTSFSNHNPNEEACDEKSVLLTPKQHLSLTTSTIVIPNEQLQQSMIPKNVNVDLKQQFSSKLKLGSSNDNNDTCSINHNSYNSVGSKNDHHPIKPVRSITPKRNSKSSTSTDNDVDDDDDDADVYQRTNRSSSARSNDSTAVTASTVSSFMSTSINGKKKVRFAADRKGYVHCEYFRNMNPKSKQESLECFYQMNDFQQFRRECKQEAILQQKTSTYRDNFAAVYAACTTGNFKNVTRERAYISAASCRGLEVVVFPTLHSDRKSTIATILKTQRSLPATMTDYSERSETIAAASRYLSKQARQLARVFGSGDAAVVIANQRIESIQQQQQTQKQTPQQQSSSSRKPCSDSDDQSSDDATTQIKPPRRKSNSSAVIPHCFVTC